MAADQGRRPATISDVAAAAGVSSATVSRVMNDLSTVDAALADRVRRAVRDLDYVPSGLARSLSLGVTKTIGMVVPDLSNPMFQQILAGLNRAASADGYRVLVADAQENAQEEVALARDTRKRTDAVVLCAPRMDADVLSRLVVDVAPAVVINRVGVGGDTPVVSVDYAAGIRSLAEHLVMLGHRRLVFLAGPPNSASNRARIAGLDRFRAEHPGVTVTVAVCGSSMNDGYQSWDAVRDSGASAVLAFNDIVALGLLGRLHEEGISVPHDLSVTGFDDIQMARFSTPTLTTMSVSQTEMGENAWRQLRSLMAGESPRVTTVFRPELVVRASTGAPA